MSPRSPTMLKSVGPDCSQKSSPCRPRLSPSSVQEPPYAGLRPGPHTRCAPPLSLDGSQLQSQPPSGTPRGGSWPELDSSSLLLILFLPHWVTLGSHSHISAQPVSHFTDRKNRPVLPRVPLQSPQVCLLPRRDPALYFQNLFFFKQSWF